MEISETCFKEKSMNVYTNPLSDIAWLHCATNLSAVLEKMILPETSRSAANGLKG